MDHLLTICRTTLTSELAATASPQVTQNAVPFTTSVAGFLQSRIGRMLPSLPLVPRSMATSVAAQPGPLCPIRQTSDLLTATVLPSLPWQGARRAGLLVHRCAGLPPPFGVAEYFA